ncbi:MAG TPA: sugar phosphate isomerase/epimerase [Vicinamibacterales bacterium]
MYTRRELGRMALGVPAAWLLANRAAARGRPGSVWGGVQVGIIAPYAFQRTANTAEEILDRVVALGISAVELQNDPVERYAGAPEMPRVFGPPRSGPGGGRPSAGAAPAQAPPLRRELTPEQQEERRRRAGELRTWRLSAPMTKFEELRRRYEQAGVRIYAFKLALTDAMPDAEFDYAFSVAKTLGASHLTMELPDRNPALTARIARFGEKHGIVAGYHQHEQATFTLWDEALAQSRWNGVNLDIGHYVAGTSESPIPFIERHHARITSIHLKDRRKNRGPNMPWGQGDTPIREVLQLMKRNRYTFPATIELEYRVEGSDPMTELKKCVEFCRSALDS